MIAYLNGTIRKKLAKSLIIDIGGIGYLVNVPTPLFEKTDEASTIELYTYTRVREDDISIYGFENTTELDFFKTLINVNGIGPKLGLEIMSQDLDKVAAAIMGEDAKSLSGIPGIGKKTAERIIVELKNKINPGDFGQINSADKQDKPLNEDVIDTLMSLGYQRFEIMRVIKNMPEQNPKAEDIITYFLRNV